MSSNPLAPARHSCVWPGCPRNARLCRKYRLFARSISSPDSQIGNLRAPIGESLRPCPRIFVLQRLSAETGFDHDCRPVNCRCLQFRRAVLGAVSPALPPECGIYFGRPLSFRNNKRSKGDSRYHPALRLGLVSYAGCRWQASSHPAEGYILCR